MVASDDRLLVLSHLILRWNGIENQNVDYFFKNKKLKKKNFEGNNVNILVFNTMLKEMGRSI